MRTFILILGTSLLIAACGTKGPLTLPPKPSGDASMKTEAGR